MKKKNAIFARWIADQMILEQAKVPQQVEVRFSERGREQAETILPAKKAREPLADPDGSQVSFVLSELVQAFTHQPPQTRFIGKLRSGICHRGAIH
jgi:hypothetical protein